MGTFIVLYSFSCREPGHKIPLQESITVGGVNTDSQNGLDSHFGILAETMTLLEAESVHNITLHLAILHSLTDVQAGVQGSVKSQRSVTWVTARLCTQPQ